MKKPRKGDPPIVAMGRIVKFNSPAQHPQSDDPLAPTPRRLSRLDIADFDRNRPSAAGAEQIKREPAMEYTEGGPQRNGGGSLSHNTMRSRRGPLKDVGKRGWKQNQYGGGSVN